jgi:hypothetical protein
MRRLCSPFEPRSPASFGRDETIDVATLDDAFDASLSLTNGGLALENSHVAVATFTPAKAFGASAYGPLKYRVSAKGVAGDWQPLANLVRLPMLKETRLPGDPGTGVQAHRLEPVPDRFGVERCAFHASGPSSGRLSRIRAADSAPWQTVAFFVKLRDDPGVINPTTLTAEQLAGNARRPRALRGAAAHACIAGDTGAAVHANPASRIERAACDTGHAYLANRTGAADGSCAADTTHAAAAASSAHATAIELRATVESARMAERKCVNVNSLATRLGSLALDLSAMVVSRQYADRMRNRKHWRGGDDRRDNLAQEMKRYA